MTLTSNQAKLRERWKLAKRAQRERRKYMVRPVCPVFRFAVFEERDRRAGIAWKAKRKINGIFIDVAGTMGAFVADVWAIKILLIAEMGFSRATPTQIARRLLKEKMAHNYARSSLRPMVYRALQIIKDLEEHGQGQNEPPFWEASDLMLDGIAERM